MAHGPWRFGALALWRFGALLGAWGVAHLLSPPSAPTAAASVAAGSEAAAAAVAQLLASLRRFVLYFDCASGLLAPRSFNTAIIFWSPRHAAACTDEYGRAVGGCGARL